MYVYRLIDILNNSVSLLIYRMDLSLDFVDYTCFCLDNYLYFKLWPKTYQLINDTDDECLI